jgi:peptide/nickel transport system permease protein
MTDPNSIFWKRFVRDKWALFAAVYIALVAVAGITASLWCPDSSDYANTMSLEHRFLPPGAFSDISGDGVLNRHLLGTDAFGRDVFSRVVWGIRVSLSIGFVAVLISILIGIPAGAVAGYFGGVTDKVVMWVVNVVWSIPTLLLVMAITLALGKGPLQIYIAVGLTMWVEVARVVRGQVMAISKEPYIEAGRALGYGALRLIFRHVLPPVIAPVIVISAANFATAILVESGLSFLGFGVQPPVPSWGSLVRDNYAFMLMGRAHLALAPGLAIVTLVLAFMQLGSGIRAALGVKVNT